MCHAAPANKMATLHFLDYDLFKSLPHCGSRCYFQNVVSLILPVLSLKPPHCSLMSAISSQWPPFVLPTGVSSLVSMYLLEFPTFYPCHVPHPAMLLFLPALGYNSCLFHVAVSWHLALAQSAKSNRMLAYGSTWD